MSSQFHPVTADLHAHLGDVSSREELSALLARAENAGIRRIVSAVYRLEGFEHQKQIAAAEGGRIEILTAFGIHPWFAGPLRNNSEWNLELKKILQEEFGKTSRVYRPAVGEIGLDYGVRGLALTPKEIQREIFQCQLEIAEELKRPVILHSYGAALETLETVSGYPQIPMVLFHGFIGTIPEKMLNERFFFSFSAREIGPNRRRGRETAERLRGRMPILAESDYPAGGNEPAGAVETGRLLAEMGIDVFSAEEDFFGRWRASSLTGRKIDGGECD